MTPDARDILTTPDLLCGYYTDRGLEPPQMRSVDPARMPQPYRTLLVHDRDMTTTLEDHWRAPLHIEVLEQHHEGDLFCRLVVLRTDRDNTPVEFGAIRIHLDGFDESAREEITQCRRPLGAILREHHEAYSCQPSAFFAIWADALTGPVFGAERRTELFGRHNTLFAPDEVVLAEVVEILPPMTETP